MTAHLKCVFGTVSRLLDANDLLHACVLDLLAHEFIIKVQLLLQKKQNMSSSDRLLCTHASCCNMYEFPKDDVTDSQRTLPFLHWTEYRK